MWNYEKRLEYPVNIKETNPKIAQYIISQYGGLHWPNRQSVQSAASASCQSASRIWIDVITG